MRADLKKRKLLFKAKTQPWNSNSNSGQIRDEWHNTEVDEQMHSRDAKIVDLTDEHLQTKEKTRIRRRGYEREVER
jgi:hypothetical protein